jgi:hypothetical protein
LTGVIDETNDIHHKDGTETHDEAANEEAGITERIL